MNVQLVLKQGSANVALPVEVVFYYIIRWGLGWVFSKWVAGSFKRKNQGFLRWTRVSANFTRWIVVVRRYFIIWRNSWFSRLSLRVWFIVVSGSSANHVCILINLKRQTRRVQGCVTLSFQIFFLFRKVFLLSHTFYILFCISTVWIITYLNFLMSINWV